MADTSPSTAPMAPALSPDLRAWTADCRRRLEPEALRAEVRSLLGPRSRIHHPHAMARAEQQLLETFAQAGWYARRQPFTVSAGIGMRDHGDFARTRYRNLHGANVVAVKPGDQPAALVVLAHLDTVRDSPGANDNTAAVVALLCLSRLLAPLRLPYTVVLAATDFEEIGLFGARALVSSLKGERPVIGAINLETIAYVDRRPGTQRLPAGIGALYPRQLAALRRRGLPADFVALIHDVRARRLTETYAAALAQTAGADVPVSLRAPAALARHAPLLIHAVPLVRNFARGDHAVFWQAGIPALQVTDTANFRYGAYHRAGDLPDRLDYDRLAELIAATAATLRAGDLAPGGRGPSAEPAAATDRVSPV